MLQNLSECLIRKRLYCKNAAEWLSQRAITPPELEYLKIRFIYLNNEAESKTSPTG